MRVRFYEINWDTTDDEHDEPPSTEACGLPSECILDVGDALDVEEVGADVLSNEYGFCVFGFNHEVLEQN